MASIWLKHRAGTVIAPSSSHTRIPMEPPMSDRTLDQTTRPARVRTGEDDYAIRAQVRAEYQEMPGLSLTLAQAARLFNVEQRRCAHVLDALVADGALWTNGQRFLGANLGRRTI
jgi:hypothetical protein